MNEILKFAHVSCHHGATNDENKLSSAMKILDLYKEIDIIEIDFIYVNNQFISSHDYDTIQGEPLEMWIDEIVKRDKILWIDLKDTSTSFFIKELSKLNIEHLYILLNNLSLKYKNLHHHLLIGCQYSHAYNLLSQNSFTIIRDLPRDTMYFLTEISPISIEKIVIKSILEDIGDSNIIAIDRNFLTEEGLLFILNLIPSEIIIIYNYNKDESIPFVRNKYIIIQYNYYI